MIEYIEAAILIVVGVLILVTVRGHRPGWMLLAVIIYVRCFIENTFSLSANLQVINTVGLVLGVCFNIVVAYAAIVSTPALKPGQGIEWSEFCANIHLSISLLIEGRM
jgi:hypothetical protein